MNKIWMYPEYVKRADAESLELREKRFRERNGYPSSWSFLTLKGNLPNEYPKTYIELKGNVAKIRHIEKPPTNQPGMRSDITQLTSKSRKRLQEFLASIRWEKFNPDTIYEVTLTYHKNYPDDGQEVKRQLHNFRRELMTKYPDSIIIWKLEFQRRGAPHYHLILITKEPVELGNYVVIKDGAECYYNRDEKKVLENGQKGLRYYIQKSWNKHTKESEQHFNSGIEVEEVRSPTGLPYYMTKYIAKESEFDSYQHQVPEWFQNCGRWWGCYNKQRLGIDKRKLRIRMETKDQLEKSVKKYWSDKGLPEYKTHEYGLSMYAMTNTDLQRYVWDVLIDNGELMN